MKKNENIVKESLIKLRNYIEAEDFSGWDPYDGLNSLLFNSIPYIRKNRMTRLLWIQAFKKSPLNLRKISLVKKGLNPKALSLFVSGYVNLFRVFDGDDCRHKAAMLADKLLEMATPGFSGLCWGYNFDWQSKSAFFPRFHPTVVVTSFAGFALIDIYEITKDEKYLGAARSACDFILNDLYRSYDSHDNFTFSYSPEDQLQVFNAGLLGARLLCSIGALTGESELFKAARSVIAFNCNKQNPNGSWYYSPLPFHQWIDNFHTGFNLDCIRIYEEATEDKSFNQNLMKGLNYYINHLMTSEGIPAYYSNRVFPIDIHAAAQMLITLSEMNKSGEYSELIEKLVRWTIGNMQNRKGYFYYRKYKIGMNRIPYMRWSQAWMFLSLTTLMKQGIDFNG